MNFNYKIFFKYLFFKNKHIFLNLKKKNYKNTALLISNNIQYWLILHFKLASVFHSTQLIEIFAYELPNINKNKNHIKINKLNTVVYNFHSIYNSNRFFIFILSFTKNNWSKLSNNTSDALFSITELFLNANWLEREMIELHGVFLYNKKDIRNLMLQYGDTSAPFQKNQPSIGIREIFFDPINDFLIQKPVSIQF